MIVSAAIVLDDGRIFTGWRHYKALYRAIEDGALRLQTVHARQGFMTDKGEFLSREDAKVHAILADQLTPEHRGLLYSEDLWPDADGEKDRTDENYNRADVPSKLCMMCDEPIGNLDYREVRTLARFGQMMFEHVGCPVRRKI